jgi:hypothetical protein
MIVARHEVAQEFGHSAFKALTVRCVPEGRLESRPAIYPFILNRLFADYPPSSFVVVLRSRFCYWATGGLIPAFPENRGRGRRTKDEDDLTPLKIAYNPGF